MIRKKQRTAAQEAALAYKRSAPIGVGETRDEQKERDDAEEARVIKEVRAFIWRTRHCCQLCGGGRKHECAGMPDEMHEEPPRSKTRGMPAHMRFNTVVCGRLCKACHRDVTENRLRIVFENPALGFVGTVTGEPQ